MIGEKVRVHFNLHKKMWSITVKGKVIANVDSVLLSGVRFVVSEAGWQRSQRLGKRTVHAWAEGILVGVDVAAPAECSKRIRYNPFRASFFHTDAEALAPETAQAYFQTVTVDGNKFGYSFAA